MKLRPLLAPIVGAALLSFSTNVAQAVKPRVPIGTESASDLEVGCDADTTKALVRKFVRNYNEGRVAAMDRLWAREPRFEWFSTGPPGARFGPRAYNRASLVAYFRGRVRAQERIRLTELHAGYDPARNLVHFKGKLVRSARDLRLRPPHDFKGAADCETGRPVLIVWSM
jgi:hypothetical protein